VDWWANLLIAVDVRFTLKWASMVPALAFFGACDEPPTTGQFRKPSASCDHLQIWQQFLSEHCSWCTSKTFDRLHILTSATELLSSALSGHPVRQPV
jgi:hypothetical protein